MDRIDYNERLPLRLLTYGKAGAGKTSLCATAGLDQRTSPVLWIDAGGNPSVLRRFKGLKIHVLRLNQITELAEIFNWLANDQLANDPIVQLLGLKPPYKSLVFDGFTHIQRRSFAAVMGTEHMAPGMIPPRPDWKHYGSVLSQMTLIASSFYQLANMHIIATCLEGRDQRTRIPGSNRAEDQYVFHEPLLHGQTLDELPAWAYSVGRIAPIVAWDTEVRSKAGATSTTEGSILQFRYTQNAFGKDQHGLGDYHLNPTISQFLDKLGY